MKVAPGAPVTHILPFGADRYARAIPTVFDPEVGKALRVSRRIRPAAKVRSEDEPVDCDEDGENGVAGWHEVEGRGQVAAAIAHHTHEIREESTARHACTG